MIVAYGPVFWILLMLAVAAVVVYLERLMELRRANIDCDDFVKGIINVLDCGNDDEALAICEDAAVPVAAVVATAIRQRHGSARVLREAVDAQGRSEVGRLERRLATLAIFGQMAPILGLLGTILGFIDVVRAVDAAEVVVRSELMRGAMQALVTAALGLAIAVPVSVMYSSLRLRMDRIILDLEAAASRMLGYIAIKESQK